MTSRLEGGLLVGAAALAGLGIALVDLATGSGPDATVGLSVMMVALAFLGLQALIRRTVPGASPLLLPPVALVTVFGLIMIYRLDPDRAALQRWWLVIGAGLAAVGVAWLSRAGTETLRRYRYLLLLASLGLLALPALPSDGPLPIKGYAVNGSRLWVRIDLGVVELNLQPAELAKVLLVVFLAAYLADRQSALSGAHRTLGRVRIPEPRQLMPLAVVWAGSLLVLVAQRDLGASLLLFGVFVAMLYAATGERGYLLAGGLLAGAAAVVAWLAFDHVRVRVEAWLRPFADFEGSGYQIAQGLFGMASGSLAGSGPGVGRPDLIPNASTDFIFAAVAEEFGFAGSVAVLCLYALTVAVAFGIALRSRDRFRKLLATGLGFVVGFQTFLIIGGVLRVVPLTGITLPFMSYGGSSLLGNFLILGLLAVVSHEESS
jgi:cell division protein FtsW (lipid II flippase)